MFLRIDGPTYGMVKYIHWVAVVGGKLRAGGTFHNSLEMK